MIGILLLLFSIFLVPYLDFTFYFRCPFKKRERCLLHQESMGLNTYSVANYTYFILRVLQSNILLDMEET